MADSGVFPDFGFVQFFDSDATRLAAIGIVGFTAIACVCGPPLIRGFFEERRRKDERRDRKAALSAKLDEQAQRLLIGKEDRNA